MRRRPELRRAGGRAALAVATLAAATATWAAEAELLQAARRGDYVAVQRLLKTTDADVHAADGMTALLWAAQANDVELARLLLESGADPNRANRYGITPLWLAATNRSPSMVELLLQHGARADAALPHGETALMAAARAGDVDAVELLLEAGADPNAADASLGETALMWAAAENHADVIRVLVAGGADPNQASRELNLPPMLWEQTGMVSTVLPVGGWTPLMLAARQNARDAAIALVEVGADIDAQDPDGTTALHLALINHHFDLAADLLRAGADPNVADRAGMTALYASVDMVTPQRHIGRPPLPRHSKLSALDIIEMALAAGADPNAQLSAPPLENYRGGFPDRAMGAGTTALMRAARSLDVEAIRLLLAAGADPNLTQANGTHVLFFLAGARDEKDAARVEEVFGLLVGAGADVNAATAQGETPLHRAARQGNAKLAALLVEHGARIDARDGAGRTALDVATQTDSEGSRAIAEMLSRLGER